MADAPFDPSGAVTFDLSVGRVSLAHASARVLAPADGLTQLCEAAGEDATRTFGRAIGTSMGERVARRVTESGIASMTIEAYLEHVRGEFAIAGLGVVSIERWGSALLFVVEHANVPPHLVASVLDGVLEASTGRKTMCVELMESEERSRFLVTGQDTAKRVSAWLDEGVSWGEVMVKLHVGGDATKPRGEA
jgi:hypothetical protein